MRVFDPLLFLTGHRGAIERIAATRHSWIVGAILVLSAGIARNYDHLDLLREPEWFIGPFAASLVSIVFIFLWIAGPLKLKEAGKLGPQFLTFLTFAWMTAPCAWLYGIPAEAMTDIVTATKWNIAFLAIVSLWRVVLMTRAVAVMTGAKALRVLPLILAPAALEMMVGSFFKSLSLIGIMGGVRLPPHTDLLKRATDFASVGSFWVFVVALIACLGTKGTASSPLHRPAVSLPRSWVVLSGAALALWGIAAFPFHRPIVHRDRLQALIRSGDHPAAVAFAASKKRADFPKQHYLPPAPDGRSFPFELLDALPADTPAWLRDEWTSNAVEALKLGLSLSDESWEKVNLRHPSILRAVEEHAMRLKAMPVRDRDDEHWLRDYEWLTHPREAAETNQRPHPEQVPPATR